MVEISISYKGQLRCTAQHQPSSTQVVTDAPVDNHGRGESFSPTDLCATALGSCMLTIMGIVADRNSWDIAGSAARVIKKMNATPRRIAELEVEIRVKGSSALDAEARKQLEGAAHSCPVRLSLLDAIRVPVNFVWE